MLAVNHLIACFWHLFEGWTEVEVSALCAGEWAFRGKGRVYLLASAIRSCGLGYTRAFFVSNFEKLLCHDVVAFKVQQQQVDQSATYCELESYSLLIEVVLGLPHVHVPGNLDFDQSVDKR